MANRCTPGREKKSIKQENDGKKITYKNNNKNNQTKKAPETKEIENKQTKNMNKIEERWWQIKMLKEKVT